MGDNEVAVTLGKTGARKKVSEKHKKNFGEVRKKKSGQLTWDRGRREGHKEDV